MASDKSNSTASYRVIRELPMDSGAPLRFVDLEELERQGLCGLDRLPYSLRVVLESVLRNSAGAGSDVQHIERLCSWRPQGVREEIAFKPARVVLQDFTGVPALVDLAAMRDAMEQLGRDPSKINPLIPCDLVVDHSVQVDFSAIPDALKRNEELEFERNAERYTFLKWGQSAFSNFRVVPPATGIVHQVNVEYLSQVAFVNDEQALVYPDSCVGTDSHTPMVNGLGVLAWGVGGIEAEAVMLDQPVYMLVPDVVGIRLSGELNPGITATDLVLDITERCRRFGVVGKFVEFFGSGLDQIGIADRTTISNMAPEQGSTVSFFPVDERTLEYLRLTGRDRAAAVVERYTKAQRLFRTKDTPDPEYSAVLEIDLGSIEPAVAGPKRPHDRIPLKQLGPTYQEVLRAPIGPMGYGLKAEELHKTAKVELGSESVELSHGSVVIAAITSCTNTSNPSVMLSAGLVAQKAVQRGLQTKPFVKTSLAPGSRAVTDYLKKAGLIEPLEALGFHVVGYGCTTCIGNSGPLMPVIGQAIQDNELVVSAVLSGNRNFEGRVHPLTRTNYLASPPLVVAFALAGSTAIDITKEPLGQDQEGKDVYLTDLWPTSEELEAAIGKAISADLFKQSYADVFKGSAKWQSIATAKSELYEWDAASTYIQKPPFFEGFSLDLSPIASIEGARALGLFGDSVTTDHISPAGRIALNSPAAGFLKEEGVSESDFNSYGSRRGNHNVMMRGTFANTRIRNELVPGSEGNVTLCHLNSQQTSFFDAAMFYAEQNVPLIVIAGKEYGTGSSRDWAAKGPQLLGIRAVIAESFERIHRSNLVGMGVLPLEFEEGQSASALGLDGAESFSIALDDSLSPRCSVAVVAATADGKKVSFNTVCRIDTPVELDYYRDGGILCTVLKRIAKEEG